jgi:PHD-finger
MASRDGMFLEEEERRRLIQQLESRGVLKHSNSKGKPGRQRIAYTSSDTRSLGNDTGCLMCGKDDDHNNLMLCEGCNDEYHIYCLDPPLASVPHDDWYCNSCTAKSNCQTTNAPLVRDDGLSDQVNALPREFTSRFGEVCFANGGFGFGWWPSCIFDPRLTEGGARQTARKNLGKKHLIYFFSCPAAPFAVVSNAKIAKWHEGLAENYHLGKAARAVGKQRALQFQLALQAAVTEENKPLHMRLDFHRSEEQPQLLPLPKQKPGKEPLVVAAQLSPPGNKRARANSRTRGDNKHRNSKQKGGPEEEEALFCKVMKRVSGKASSKSYDNIGFVKVGMKSNYADVRRAIKKDIVPDGLPEGVNYKFHVATLGPVSMKQETSLGPVLPFLRSGIGGNVSNGGTISDPIAVFIFEVGDKH